MCEQQFFWCLRSRWSISKKSLPASVACGPDAQTLGIPRVDVDSSNCRCRQLLTVGSGHLRASIQYLCSFLPPQTPVAVKNIPSCNQSLLSSYLIKCCHYPSSFRINTRPCPEILLSKATFDTLQRSFVRHGMQQVNIPLCWHEWHHSLCVGAVLSRPQL